MSDFANRLIAWQKIHGRHDLPWQNTTDPYIIWVSEIMLQQTQVVTVIDYFGRFIQRFPDICSLANATQDEVLKYWSGLGYYSRARNLHHAATTIMDEHNGEFPQDFETIQSLSGIGRSTAAAIASFAFNQVQTILDGNVKRVLARHFLIEGWPNSSKVEKKLWSLAEELLPEHGIIAYTQSLMDLGATVCTRSKPQCRTCPLIASCKAFQNLRVDELPTAKPRKAIPEIHTTMLILQHGDEVLLEKRISSGIWGGLWSFPEVENDQVAEITALNKFGLIVETCSELPNLIHTFSHFKLHIHPHHLQVLKKINLVNQQEHIWMDIDAAIEAAIPSPIRKILFTIKKSST